MKTQIRLLRGALATMFRRAAVSFKTRDAIFREIYQKNRWGSRESRSGIGSTVSSTQALRQELPPLLARYGIRSLLDVPCGDFNWMQLLDLPGIAYVGADIVPELIEENRRRYQNDRRRFDRLDIVADPFEAFDLVMVRDLFNHLPAKDVILALKGIRASGSTYLLAGHYTRVPANRDVYTGGSRLLNLCLPPFCLPPPLEVIVENYEPHREFGRSMALWKLEAIGT